MNARRFAALILATTSFTIASVQAEPVQVWEIKLADSVLGDVGQPGAGADGSVIVSSGVTAPRLFWVRPESLSAVELTKWGVQGTVLVYVSSKDVVLRMSGVVTSNLPNGRLFHFSLVNGAVVFATYDLPGDPVGGQNFLGGPVLFYRKTVKNGATYLTAWKIPELESSRTTALHLDRLADGSLVLNADSGSPNSMNIDASTDLKSWRLLTNVTGKASISLDGTDKGGEFFRGR